MQAAGLEEGKDIGQTELVFRLTDQSCREEDGRMALCCMLSSKAPLRQT